LDDVLNDTVIDQKLFVSPSQTTAGPTVASSLDGLLLSENPGVGMISPEDWVNLAQYLQLSARELSVGTLIFEGNSRFQVAKRLNCSPETTRVYIDRLFAKLNVRDRLGMVLRVLRIHLALVSQRGRSACHTKM
jgi:DNA-binding NarL/FixJ family response regulator